MSSIQVCMHIFRCLVIVYDYIYIEYWGNVSEEAKDLIKHLLVLDVNKRFTVQQALKHSWLTRQAGELEGRNLGSNLKTLRRYNARRKLRAGIKAIMAANRMKAMLNDFKEINAKKRAKKEGEVREAAVSPKR